MHNNTCNCRKCDITGSSMRCEKAKKSMPMFQRLPVMATGPFDDYNGQASCDIESSKVGSSGSSASVTWAADSMYDILMATSPAW